MSAVAASGAASDVVDDGSNSNGTKLIDLTDKLDKSACYARNEDSRFTWTNLMIGDTRLGCKSDTDEQLILHFAFNEFVKVRLFFYYYILIFLSFGTIRKKRETNTVQLVGNSYPMIVSSFP